MKFKATENINLRETPSINGKKIRVVLKGTCVESDEYSWKAVMLPDGTTGFCAAEYLEQAAEEKVKWVPPIRKDKFIVTQKFLTPDPLYTITGHHPGTDYGTQGDKNVPLYFCANGEVIESGVHNAFGNYFFYYVPEVDRTFVYFHLRDEAPAQGSYSAGEQCGITGETGLSQGIHLHLECMKGKKKYSDRKATYTSKSNIEKVAEDADAFIRERL